jgi:hypothetical protein
MVGAMSSSDTSMPAPRQSPVMKIVAAVAAVAVLAFGASAVAKHGSSSSSASPGGQGAPQGFSPQGGQAPPQGAQGGPGMFAPVTGATLAKLKAAATAKYPGTVERAVKLPDGSYEVHVVRSGGQEVHVLVSRDFKVTGTERRDFRGAPPAGQAAPDAGATPTGTQS